MFQDDFPSFHIAVIMDGNRRWAEERHKPSYEGHRQGSAIIEEIALAAQDEGANWLTLFAFSTENWGRSKYELSGIMRVLREYLKDDISLLLKHNIRLRAVGNLEDFPSDIASEINQAIEDTKNNTGLNLTVALGYGGQSDLVEAMRKIAHEVKLGRIAPEAINETLIKNNLTSAELPPIDLLIRTGREKRLSNFMPWELAYAELAFSEVLWPDFTGDALKEIIAEYWQRERRFGKGESNTLIKKSAGGA